MTTKHLHESSDDSPNLNEFLSLADITHASKLNRVLDLALRAAMQDGKNQDISDVRLLDEVFHATVRERVKADIPNAKRAVDTLIASNNPRDGQLAPMMLSLVHYELCDRNQITDIATEANRWATLADREDGSLSEIVFDELGGLMDGLDRMMQEGKEYIVPFHTELKQIAWW